MFQQPVKFWFGDGLIMIGGKFPVDGIQADCRIEVVRTFAEVQHPTRHQHMGQGHSGRGGPVLVGLRVQGDSVVGINHFVGQANRPAVLVLGGQVIKVGVPVEIRICVEANLAVGRAPVWLLVVAKRFRQTVERDSFGTRPRNTGAYPQLPPQGESVARLAFVRDGFQIQIVLNVRKQLLL